MINELYNRFEKNKLNIKECPYYIPDAINKELKKRNAETSQ